MPLMTAPTALVAGAVDGIELPSWSAAAVTDVPTAVTVVPTAVVTGVRGLPPAEGGGCGEPGDPLTPVGAPPAGIVGEGSGDPLVAGGPLIVTCPPEALPGRSGESLSRAEDPAPSQTAALSVAVGVGAPGSAVPAPEERPTPAAVRRGARLGRRLRMGVVAAPSQT